MTMPQEVSPEKRFVPATLPWLVATGALLLYLFTLNFWVSFNSLGQVARVSGWVSWQPDLNAPLFWLVTYPFHWLPPRLIPVALNLLAAICASVTLALLARSVALLPHDRTEAQRIRERSPFSLLALPTAWVPPVVAALVCGLQLTFWENATAASGEIFDLLPFAYIIRCLLEFRLEGRDSWLLRAALVYGAAITENWAMLGFLPLFLLALLWLKGLTFFNGRFLGRMSLLALAGLSLYLLLPLLSTLTHQLGFWDGLKANLGAQKFYLSRLVFSKIALFKIDRPLWVLALPSIVPILLLSIRWPASFGDTSKLGQGLATFILNFTYGVFLALCAWVALDPERFGPRHSLSQVPMLTFYYLGALSIGYFVGYFLMVFGSKPTGRPRPTSAFAPLVNAVVLGAVALLALLTPLLLVYRNLPQVRITNGPALRQYAASLASELPAGNTIALSDDPGKSLLLQSAFTQGGRANPPLLLDTSWLQYPAYHRFLKRTYPLRWPSEPPPTRRDLFGALDLIQLMRQLAQTNALYYLHSSFGYYFEAFYAEPHGLVSRLSSYPTNSLLAPRISQPTIDQNEEFWSRLDDSTLKPLLSAVAPSTRAKHSGLLDRLSQELHLDTEANLTATRLAEFYSRALDNWGVTLQRFSPAYLPQAANRFAQAIALNPNNIVAQANLECNRDLQAGTVPSRQVSAAIQDQFGKFKDWDDVMNANGPFDHPTFCYAQGQNFGFVKSARLLPQYHQAAQQFARVIELVPNDLDPRLRLAEIYVLSGLPDAALEVVAEIHRQAAALALTRTNQPEVMRVEVAAHLSRRDLAGAESVIQAALRPDPNDFELLSAASRMYMTYEYYSNALVTIGRQLSIHPEDPNACYGEGLASLQLKLYDRSLAAFTRVMRLETNHTSDLHAYALFYRAQSWLGAGKLDEAQRDYEALQKDIPSAVSLYKELAELALRKGDTNAAIRNFESYLANISTNSLEEAKLVRERLKQLRPGSR